MFYNKLLTKIFIISSLSIVVFFFLPFESKAFIEKRESENYLTRQPLTYRNNQSEYIAKILQEIKKQPLNTSLKERLALYYIKEKNFDSAIELFKKILIINPKSSVHYNALGSVYGYKGDMDNAIENYKKSIKLNSSDRKSVV